MEVDTYIDNIVSKIQSNSNLLELLEIKDYEFKSDLKFLKHIFVQCCDCLLVQNNIAAITTSNLLLEITIKHTIEYRNTYCQECFEKTISRQNSMIGSIDDKSKLSEGVKYLYDNRIINDDEFKVLNSIREMYRNRFSHGSFAKTYSEDNNPLSLLHALPGAFTLATYIEANRDAYTMFIDVFYFVKKFDELLSESVNVEEMVEIC